ncbi:hypothetical protein, partial [Burkholderia ambifaria]|uniref:hypothetical protein n=1 Tax=Burkholderia ambifaria TaxID=152480 RepID=UPI000B008763
MAAQSRIAGMLRSLLGRGDVTVKVLGREQGEPGSEVTAKAFAAMLEHSTQSAPTQAPMIELDGRAVSLDSAVLTQQNLGEQVIGVSQADGTIVLNAVGRDALAKAVGEIAGAESGDDANDGSGPVQETGEAQSANTPDAATDEVDGHGAGTVSSAYETDTSDVRVKGEYFDDGWPRNVTWIRLRLFSHTTHSDDDLELDKFASLDSDGRLFLRFSLDEQKYWGVVSSYEIGSLTRSGTLSIDRRAFERLLDRVSNQSERVVIDLADQSYSERNSSSRGTTIVDAAKELPMQTKDVAYPEVAALKAWRVEQEKRFQEAWDSQTPLDKARLDRDRFGVSVSWLVSAVADLHTQKLQSEVTIAGREGVDAMVWMTTDGKFVGKDSEELAAGTQVVLKGEGLHGPQTLEATVGADPTLAGLKLADGSRTLVEMDLGRTQVMINGTMTDVILIRNSRNQPIQVLKNAAKQVLDRSPPFAPHADARIVEVSRMGTPGAVQLVIGKDRALLEPDTFLKQPDLTVEDISLP